MPHTHPPQFTFNGQPLSGMLQVQVSKKHVKDYNNFVQPEDEIWIKKINGKLAKSGYSSRQQFLADVHQMRANAEAYNLGGGLCAFPGNSCLQLLEMHWTCPLFAVYVLSMRSKCVHASVCPSVHACVCVHLCMCVSNHVSPNSADFICLKDIPGAQML